MFIYKITNKINGKVYIGQTINNINDRFRRHINDSNNNILDTHFARAIKKYGEENFYIEKIDEANSQEELTLKEKYWIDEYDSINNGYNETNSIYKCGGNTYLSKTKEEMDIIKEKIRKTKIGSLNPNARKVKITNISDEKEIIFGSIRECANYFNLKGKTPLTIRLNGSNNTLYKGLYKIEYFNE
jgi:group I intron endonuclease